MQLCDIIFLVILLAQLPEFLSNLDTIFTLIGAIPKLIGGSPKNPHWWMLSTCIPKLQITRRRNSGPGQSEKGKIDNSIAFDHLKDERDTTDFTVSSS